MDEHRWNVRVVGAGPAATRAYFRNHSLAIGAQLSFREADDHPSALELLLAALGGDLMSGWRAGAERAGLTTHAIELTLSARLEQPLVALRVVGESGHPGLAEISGTLYVSTDAAPDDARRVWLDVLARSPIHATLARAATLAIEFKLSD